MTDTQLSTLSTFAWLVGAVTLFILLARRSTGSSWGISTAVARGLIGWTGRNGIIAGEWSSDGELPPIDARRLDDLGGAQPDPDSSGGTRVMGANPESPPIAELVDLGARPLR